MLELVSGFVQKNYHKVSACDPKFGSIIKKSRMDRFEMLSVSSLNRPF